MSSIRQNILNKSKKKSLVISPECLADTDTPEVEIRVMTVGERASMLAAANASGEHDAAVYQARVIIETVYIPGTDDKVFSPADQELLTSMPTDVLDEFAAHALVINGLAIESAGLAEKNSKAIPTPSTCTSSRNGSGKRSQKSRR